MAAKVFAVDGYGQLAWSLRQDPRVVSLERRTSGTLDPSELTEIASLAVIDASFISVVFGDSCSFEVTGSRWENHRLN
jgi:23S rRNA (cytidine1920-2'-O)/16S rRNA (cytidine1409-2'-O)-methyltransferase